jgi:erythromycin esterase
MFAPLLLCVALLQNPARDSAVVEWIRTNAVPLRTVDADSGFGDLAPLKNVLKDVRVVGLGESTHGTSEFQRVKHRLVEFLVREMGYTAFAIEASYTDAQLMNEYVLHGTGNRANALSKLGYLAWDTEEFAAMVDWMRAYNRTVPDAKQVRFYGVDIYRNSLGRTKVLEAVRRVLPAAVATTDSLFRALAEQERLWPPWDTTVIAASGPRLDTLRAELERRRQTAPQGLTSAEWDETIQCVTVMRQVAQLHHRDRYMAENMIYVVEHEAPGTKFILWAHDDHVTEDSLSLGWFLRQQYGDAYYAVGLYVNQGPYLTRLISPKGDFKITNKPAADSGSLEWFLARANLPRFFLNLRSDSGGPAIGAWLHAPRTAFGGSWAYEPDLPSLNDTVKVRAWYDGLLYVSESTPTHPTANARSVVARKEGF